MMAMEELRTRLDDALVTANQDAELGYKAASSSYGTGYDFGYRDALMAVLNTINGEEDDII